MEERVILVNSQDQEIGVEEKLRAHQLGLLHRAFSVCLFNAQGELLLQQRALSKYHSGGLWTNTCCSHPRPGESIAQAVRRRLKEEMGIVEGNWQPASALLYRAELAGGLIEHEYDHIWVGSNTANPVPNPDEVMGWRYASLETLALDTQKHPEQYTAWFHLLLPQ